MFRNIKKYKYILLVTGIIILGSFLRFYRLDDRVVFYGDNSRDFLLVYKIFKFKEWVWHGPAVSVLWTLLSPIYYYLLAPFFLISKFHPLTVHFVTIFVNIFALISLIFFGNKIFGKKAAIISGFIFSFSFIVIKEAGIGLNPGLIAPFTILLFYSVHKIIKGEEKYLIFTSLALSSLLSFHASGFFVLIPMILLYVIYRPRFSLKTLFYSGGVFTLLTLIPYAIQEKKFAGYNIGVMKELITGESEVAFIQSTINFFVASSQTISDVFVPNLPILGISLAAVLLLLLIKDSYKLTYKRSSPTSLLAFFILLYLLTFVLVPRFNTGNRFDWWLAPILIPLLILYTGAKLDQLPKGKISNLFISLLLFISMFLNLRALFAYANNTPFFRMSRSKEIAFEIASNAGKKPFNLYIVSKDTEQPGGIGPLFYLLWYKESDQKIKERYFEWLNWARERKENLAYLLVEDTSMSVIEEKLKEIESDLNLSIHEKIFTNGRAEIYRIY